MQRTPSSAESSLSRRQFVQLAAGTVAGATLAARAQEGMKPIPPVAGSDQLKIGIIGCGGRGTGSTNNVLTADKAAVVWAMGDIFQDRMDACLGSFQEELKENFAPRVQAPPERRFIGFDAYQRVLDSGVDLVMLTTHPHFRPQHMEAAVAAGKHIFAEKPMGVDAPGLVRVRDAAKAARDKSLTLLSGFCWRYADAERAAVAQIHDGTIGEVQTVHSTYHTSTLRKFPRKPEWSDVEFQIRNWWHFTWVSGDHIVEQAVHSIDRLNWLMKDKPPARCVCLGGRAAREGVESGHVFDHFAVVYEYDDGRRAFLTTRQIDGAPSDNSDYVYATRGRAELNGWKPIHTLKDLSGAPVWKYQGPRKDMYQNEIDVLVDSIRNRKAHNDADFMVQSSMMAVMGRMAAYTGQTISWDQAWASAERLGPEKYEFGPLPTPPVAIPGKTKFL